MNDYEEDIGPICFDLFIDINGDGTLDVMLGGLDRESIKYMFSTGIADIVTTSLMEQETRIINGDFDDCGGDNG